MKIITKKISVLLIVATIIFTVSGCRKKPQNYSNFFESTVSSVSGTESADSNTNVDMSSTTSSSISAESRNSQTNGTSKVSSVVQSVSSSTRAESGNIYSTSSESTVNAVCTHSYQSTVIEKTCTTDGYTQHVCSKCGDSYKDNKVSAGHNFKNYYCTVCNAADKSNAGIIVYNYVQEKGVPEQYYSSNVFTFGNGLYKVSALNSGWLFFEFNDSNNDEVIKLSVYSGVLKDDCYLEYFKADSKVEFEFHKENLYSKEPDSVWNQMHHYGSISKNQMIQDIRSKIDGFMLQFQNNLLNSLGLTLKDFGFSNFN